MQTRRGELTAEESPGEPPRRPRSVSRRAFLRYGAGAGIAGTLGAMGVLSALRIVRGPEEPVPEWEVEPGVVDYDHDSVPGEGELAGPTPNVLKVAQWYDYWPGSFIGDFRTHMLNRYGLSVQIQWDVYTSNEELFHWVTLSKRRYDLIFPSNYLVDLMKKAGMIYTLNEPWLGNLGPGFSEMQAGLVSAPASDPYDRRGPNGPWVSVPYFWGTSGLGFRTDVLPRAEVKAHGYDLMWMPSYRPQAAGFPEVELVKKMRMLEDMRDVIGAGLKKAGWEAQIAKQLTPTGLFPPDGPQWTTNETDPARIAAAGHWLSKNKPLLFGYNSTDQATSLITGSAVLNQAWSGDMMYAIRPDQPTTQPVDYVIPPQGSTWWVDCAAIHNKCRNLWLAHEFINFIHNLGQNITLTQWNLYSTPNRPCYEYLLANPYPNGWNMSEDPRLYPNVYAPDDFRICDLSKDVGLSTLLDLYNPLWFDLATG